jgi:hypothetical protein
MNDMTVRVEVWPIVADPQGIWLISGVGPWTPADPVPADGDIHAEVELELYRNGIDLTDVAVLHSTSWRPGGPSVILTYAAVIRYHDFVPARWPGAMPISTLLMDEVGRPLPQPPAEPPTPRPVDVLHHLLRHVSKIVDTDDEGGPAINLHLRGHLDAFSGVLAHMYRHPVSD